MPSPSNEKTGGFPLFPFPPFFPSFLGKDPSPGESDGPLPLLGGDRPGEGSGGSGASGGPTALFSTPPFFVAESSTSSSSTSSTEREGKYVMDNLFWV